MTTLATRLCWKKAKR
jgi:hypothetical protein